MKETSTGKPDEYCVKLKMHRDTMSSTLDLYGFSMSLFDHFNPEEFLLIVQNFSMTLADTGTIEMGVKVQYIGMFVGCSSSR